MRLTSTTKLSALISQYPFLVGFLAGYDPKFAGLKNPVLRNTLGRTATLGKVAAMGGMPVARLLGALRERIETETGQRVVVEAAGATPSRGERREILKEIIRDLHAGADRTELKRRFAELIEDLGASEVAQMEQELIDAGLPQSEITKLCDVHLDIFKDALADQPPPAMPPGHPVHTFMAENEALGAVAGELRGVLAGLGERPAGAAWQGAKDRLAGLLEKLAQVELHYLRKENQLFPFLEKRGLSGPPQVMWEIHDQVRRYLKEARGALERNSPTPFIRAAGAAIKAIEDMIGKEQLVLFPMALQQLGDDEWLELRRGEAHIGYALVEPGAEWPAAGLSGEGARGVVQGGELDLHTGKLTPEQVDLLFNHLPVEISFTDERHIVRYFSEGRERIFTRSPAVIGRSVEKCHPPKSVHMVREILGAFERGERDVAEFWLELGGKFIHIRYFAVRDAGRRFRGTLEVVQDVTGIRRLEGERRLLDWR